jgi:hypothetical protein
MAVASYHELGGTNPAVLAYLRAYRDTSCSA